jgi:DNA-binding GntR family transcriptional regulator
MTVARDLGVSQSTVREALQRLERSGLVVRLPNIGTTVTRLSPKDVRERVTLRALLEGLAAMEASTRMREREFVELEEKLTRLESAVADNAYYEAAQADLDFHRFIWRCSGNETLCGVLEQITVPLIAFVSILRSVGVQHLAGVTGGHKFLVAALRSADPKIIQEAFREGAMASYAEFMDVTPETQKAFAFGLMGMDGQSR